MSAPVAYHRIIDPARNPNNRNPHHAEEIERTDKPHP
jgi:hypothetical protein